MGAMAAMGALVALGGTGREVIWVDGLATLDCVGLVSGHCHCPSVDSAQGTWCGTTGIPAHWEPLGCGVVQIHRCVAAHRERPAVGAQAQQPGVGQRIGEQLGRLILADEKRLGHHDLLRRQCHVNAENEITTRCGDFIIQRDGKPHPDHCKPFAICHLMRWRHSLWKVGMR